MSVALTALAAQIMGAIHEPALSALLVMALPGVAGIVLMAQDGGGLRFLLIGAWLLASLAAAGLTGAWPGRCRACWSCPWRRGSRWIIPARATTG